MCISKDLRLDLWFVFFGKAFANPNKQKQTKKKYFNPLKSAEMVHKWLLRHLSILILSNFKLSMSLKCVQCEQVYGAGMCDRYMTPCFQVQRKETAQFAVTKVAEKVCVIWSNSINLLIFHLLNLASQFENRSHIGKYYWIAVTTWLHRWHHSQGCLMLTFHISTCEALWYTLMPFKPTNWDIGFIQTTVFSHSEWQVNWHWVSIIVTALYGFMPASRKGRCYLGFDRGQS